MRTVLGVAAKTEQLALRLDAEQKALLEAASAAVGTTVSAYVLKVATQAVAGDLADLRAFALDQPAWQAFMRRQNRPAREVAGLRELLARPTVLDA